VRLVLLALFAYAVTACRLEHVAPDGTPLKCGSPSDNAVTCVGGGKAYKCVTSASGCSVADCGRIDSL
jgi:hypothetical protein